MIIELTAGADDAGRRLDRILRKALPDQPLSLIHRLLRQGKARVDGIAADPDTRIPAGAVIQITMAAAGLSAQLAVSRTTPAPKPDILWRGSGIIVCNKPPGLATHGQASLDTRVRAWLAGQLPPSLSFKPGPLHRLDKPTSGAVAFSESLEGARLFSRLLRERAITKTYLAIVEGCLSAAVWEDMLIRDKRRRKTLVSGETGARAALTHVNALANNGSYTLIEAHIITGRTHQIRAQAAQNGHPLAGDVKYGGQYVTGGLCLHAWKMACGERLEGFPRPLIAPPPESFRARAQKLFGRSIISVW